MAPWARACVALVSPWACSEFAVRVGFPDQLCVLVGDGTKGFCERVDSGARSSWKGRVEAAVARGRWSIGLRFLPHRCR